MKPNFILAGIQKSGTTYLDTLLRTVNSVQLLDRNLNWSFFCNDTIYSKGTQWYESLFDGMNPDKLLGQTSADCLYNPGTLERIKDFNPEMKILVILREPISRTYSQYWHEVKVGREHLSFETALEKEADRIKASYRNFKRYGYVARSRYASQIKALKETFPADQIYITTLNRLKGDELNELNRILQFLGQEPLEQIEKKESVRYNTGAVPRSILLQRSIYFLKHLGLGRVRNLIYSWNLKNEKHPPMNAETKARLQELLKEDVELFETYNVPVNLNA